MAGINRSNLPQFKRPGDSIFADEWNAVARALRPNQSGRLGWSSDSEQITRDPPRARNMEQWCFAHDAVPAYSIFAVQGNVVYDPGEPVKFQSATWGFNGGGSPLAFFTNDSIEMIGCSWSIVRPINMYDTALINWGGDVAPVVGMWCGPKPDEYTVEGGRFGFVVLGIEGSQVRVMRTDEPHAIVGVVTERITAFDPCSRELGKGRVRIEYRNADDELRDAGDPFTATPLGCGSGDVGSGEDGGSGFDVEVFNASEREYPASNCYRLMAVNTLGVGLLALTTIGEPPPEVCCSSGSESGSSSSSGSDSGGSESQACVSCFTDLCLDDIPVFQPGVDELAYVIVETADGCIKKIAPRLNCEEGSSSA